VSPSLLLLWPYESLPGFLLLNVLNRSHLPLSLRSDIHFPLSISLLSQPFYLLHLLSSYSVSHSQCFFTLSSHVTPLFHTQPRASKWSSSFHWTSYPSPKDHCKYMYFYKPCHLIYTLFKFTYGHVLQNMLRSYTPLVRDQIYLHLHHLRAAYIVRVRVTLQISYQTPWNRNCGVSQLPYQNTLIILSKHIPLQQISTAQGFISWLSDYQKSNVFMCVKGRSSCISFYSHFQFDNKLIKSILGLIPLLLTLLQLPKPKHWSPCTSSLPHSFFSVMFVHSLCNLLFIWNRKSGT